MKQDKKKSVKVKPKNDPAQILQAKEDKLDWQNFNFLENLLVFCTVPGRNAPKESGVHFRITLDSQNKSICILFKIDRNHRKHDPLIRNQALKRPDYMSLYIDSNSCICTIIEMKGTNHNSLDNGIDQILKLKDILKAEIEEHLPTKFKVKFQGILLAPYNSQFPGEKIKKVAEDGFIILPIQYNEKAELYPYVSKTNKSSDRYNHRKIDESTVLSIEETLSIEKTLTKKALPKRIKDDYYSSTFSNGKDREGIYIDYLLPNKVDCVTLSLNKSLTQIYIRGDESQKEKYKKDIKEELEKLEILNLINRLVVKFS